MKETKDDIPSQDNLIPNNDNNDNDNDNSDEIQTNPNPNLSEREKTEIVEKEISTLVDELNQIKEKGNNFFKESNFPEAEKYYRNGIEKLNSKKFSYQVNEYSDDYQALLIELKKIKKELYSNLSLILSNQNKVQEAIGYAAYILNNIDSNDEKSYIRIISWLINIKEIWKANIYAQEAKTKFYGEEEKLEAFQELFQKLDEIKKKGKKVKNNRDLYIFGTLALGSLCALGFTIWKRYY